MSVKQCVCPVCGVVAEVRRQSNGQKLRYLYCVNGHGGLTTRAKSDHWASIEQDYIGELGQLPPTAQKSEPAAPVITENVSADWVPDAADLPEVAEKEEIKQTLTPDEKDDNFAKVCLILLAAFGVGGAALVAIRKRQGA